jgi:hypothetical protein
MNVDTSCTKVDPRPWDTSIQNTSVRPLTINRRLVPSLPNGMDSIMNIDYTTIAADYAASTDRSFRATVRNTIDSDLTVAIADAAVSGDWSMVQTINTIKTTINTPVVVPTDHTAAYQTRVDALATALDALVAIANHNGCDVVPSVNTDASANIVAHNTSDVALSDDYKSIAAMVRVPRTGGTNRTYTGPRRSVPAHIESAMADVPVGGFMKIRDIARSTTDTYGDDHPSDGAVGAALFTRDGVPRTIGNIIGVIRDGNRGATIVE